LGLALVSGWFSQRVNPQPANPEVFTHLRPTRHAPSGWKLLGITQPGVCHVSIWFMWLSVIAFVIAGVLVFLGGRETLQKKVTAPPVQQTLERKSP
jgi:hypothetical protein